MPVRFRPPAPTQFTCIKKFLFFGFSVLFFSFSNLHSSHENLGAPGAAAAAHPHHLPTVPQMLRAIQGRLLLVVDRKTEPDNRPYILTKILIQQFESMLNEIDVQINQLSQQQCKTFGSKLKQLDNIQEKLSKLWRLLSNIKEIQVPGVLAQADLAFIDQCYKKELRELLLAENRFLKSGTQEVLSDERKDNQSSEQGPRVYVIPAIQVPAAAAAVPALNNSQPRTGKLKRLHKPE